MSDRFDDLLPMGLLVGTTSSASLAGCRIVDISGTISERVERWYLNPLKRMSGHDGFASLMLSLPLLEKVVRHLTPGSRDEDKFSEGSALIETLTKLLKIGAGNEDKAAVFWQMFRNGILHRGMPAAIEGWTWGFEFDRNTPIRWSGSHLLVDPWCLRDLVVLLLEKNRHAWKDGLFPLASVYKEA
jgi:hypothetical protein